MRDFTRIVKDRIEFLDSRYYEDQKSGLFYPSSTTILDAYPKPYAFYEWIKKYGEDADQIRDEAGRKGSEVHQLCEDYDNELECCMIDGVGNALYKQIEWAMFERYVEFRERFPKYELLANELHYVSPALGYGGTLDRVFEIDNGIVKSRVLVDIKTGNGLYNHFWLQLASYVQLWNEVNPDLQIDNIAILWLNAKTRTVGKVNDIQGRGWQFVRPDKGMDYYWNLFQSVQKVWNEENAGSKPRNTSYLLKHKLNEKQGEVSPVQETGTV